MTKKNAWKKINTAPMDKPILLKGDYSLYPFVGKKIGKDGLVIIFNVDLLQGHSVTTANFWMEIP